MSARNDATSQLELAAARTSQAEKQQTAGRSTDTDTSDCRSEWQKHQTRTFDRSPPRPRGANLTWQVIKMCSCGTLEAWSRGKASSNHEPGQLPCVVNRRKPNAVLLSLLARVNPSTLMSHTCQPTPKKTNIYDIGSVPRPNFRWE